MGSGLKVTVFAQKVAQTTTDKKSAQILDAIRKQTYATNDELAKIIGNITIDGIRYHINKMKKENVIVRRNGKKEDYREIL